MWVTRGAKGGHRGGDERGVLPALAARPTTDPLGIPLRSRPRISEAVAGEGGPRVQPSTTAAMASGGASSMRIAAVIAIRVYRLKCNRYDDIERGRPGDKPFGSREPATTIAANGFPVFQKEKWQSTPSGSQLAQDLLSCKRLAHKGLWHGLCQEGGGNEVQAYYVAVGSLAVWQSTWWVHGLVAASRFR